MRIAHALGMVIGCASAFALYRSVTSGLQVPWRLFGQIYIIAMGGAVGVAARGGLQSRLPRVAR